MESSKASFFFLGLLHHQAFRDVLVAAKIQEIP